MQFYFVYTLNTIRNYISFGGLMLNLSYDISFGTWSEKKIDIIILLCSLKIDW